MNRIGTWVSGASLICAIACACAILWLSAISHRRPPYIINLLGVELLCVDTGWAHGMQTTHCSLIGGSNHIGATPSTGPSIGPTWRPWGFGDIHDV